MVALDFKVAFDTVDNDVLLQGLHFDFAIGRTLLSTRSRCIFNEWCSYYLLFICFVICWFHEFEKKKNIVKDSDGEALTRNLGLI